MEPKANPDYWFITCYEDGNKFHLTNEGLSNKKLTKLSVKKKNFMTRGRNETQSLETKT